MLCVCPYISLFVPQGEMSKSSKMNMLKTITTKMTTTKNPQNKDKHNREEYCFSYFFIYCWWSVECNPVNILLTSYKPNIQKHSYRSHNFKYSPSKKTNLLLLKYLLLLWVNQLNMILLGHQKLSFYMIYHTKSKQKKPFNVFCCCK